MIKPEPEVMTTSHHAQMQQLLSFTQPLSSLLFFSFIFRLIRETCFVLFLKNKKGPCSWARVEREKKGESFKPISGPSTRRKQTTHFSPAQPSSSADPYLVLCLRVDRWGVLEREQHRLLCGSAVRKGWFRELSPPSAPAGSIDRRRTGTGFNSGVTLEPVMHAATAPRIEPPTFNSSIYRTYSGANQS